MTDEPLLLVTDALAAGAVNVPLMDLKYIWPLGRLCNRYREQAANIPWVPERPRRGARQ